MSIIQQFLLPNVEQSAQYLNDKQWSLKQLQFSAAMQRYESRPIYKNINKIVAWLNVSLQLGLLAILFQLGMSFSWHIFGLVAAFVLADFVNGFVHLYMDHNDHYASLVGPFIANFHLHHDIPRYEDKPIWQIYIDESGSKVWLLVFLIVWLVVFLFGILPTVIFGLGVYFAIWSSIAEVSHYLCHNSDSKSVRFLQSCWILLPKKHHMRHHRLDNVNYAFLNGMTDPLINWIAAVYFHGYQKTTDQHTVLYIKARQAKGLTMR
ncbi:fatty acid desaturase CarF family protein [Aquirhabdus parva]|uniref:Lipid desaturase domain-containing protein n=1 Tax=Aquirhabdus parva TaxID=2283318 RepID=A0A345P6F2_9GAMM|nr:fatty acid desaturase CarF family protein [Aquirhabdus parva]AXI02861.1 hypothetical protein HYN46_08430 [Aquirhabdus parva]